MSIATRTFLKLSLTLWGLVSTLAVLAVGGTVTGFYGHVGWIAELAAHFRVQYLVILAVGAVSATACRHYRMATAFALFAAVNALSVLPLYRPSPTPPPPWLDGTRRLVCINVNTANPRHAELLDTVRKYEPDFILLQEIDEDWMESLSGLLTDYPHAVSQPRMDNFGIALLSRHPLETQTIAYFGDAGVPSVVVRVRLPHGSAMIVGTHPVPPASRRYAAMRNRQLDEVSRFVRLQEGPLIVAGDLNTTPWAHSFKKLARETGLQNSARGWGVQPTWPAALPLMRIPIDHVLHSGGIAVQQRRVGAGFGSDHLPLIVDFAVRPPDAPGQD
jgi:endonuclease/exonuclease/phosphatase (EEP) superfamily protein YafD